MGHSHDIGPCRFSCRCLYRLSLLIERRHCRSNWRYRQRTRRSYCFVRFLYHRWREEDARLPQPGPRSCRYMATAPSSMLPSLCLRRSMGAIDVPRMLSLGHDLHRHQSSKQSLKKDLGGINPPPFGTIIIAAATPSRSSLTSGTTNVALLKIRTRWTLTPSSGSCERAGACVSYGCSWVFALV